MWTFSGTSSATGAVTVVGGTLRVNGDYSTAKRSVVKANATLGGTGKLGDVTFENGAALEVVDFAHPLHVSTLTPVGTVTLKMPHSAVMGTHTVLTYGARAGSGVFALSSDWPAGSVVAMGETALTVTVPSAVYTWTGAVSDSWDLTTANWAGGMSFLNGNSAVFDDTATRTDVVLSGVMQPVGVTVSGAKDYSFSGEGIGGSASITKTGTGRLTLKGAHGYTGFTKVGGGALVVEGALSGTSIHVASGAALTNTAASRLTGPGLIESFGAVELDGINEMTGGLFIKGGGVVKDIRALGAGDVTFGTGSNDRDVTLRVDGSCGQGKTLTCNSTAWLVVPGQKAFTWLGDVAMPRAQLKMQVDGVMTFGEPGGTTVIRDTGGSGFYLRNGGHYHFHSRIETRGRVEQTDYCTLHFYAPGSTWSQLTIAVGKAICHADNVLAPATVRMCQVWEKLSFNPVLDLNGFDQTITGLAIDTASLDVSSQTVTSETPATLTISNDVNTTTLRKQCTIKGAVTLRKKGAGTWTFGAKNATTGNVEVVEGTLALTAADALPMGADSTLFVSSGAKVSVADGVNVTVPYLVYNGFHLPPGVYRGTGGASGTVREDIFASGGGTLTVTRGKGGLTLIIR